MTNERGNFSNPERQADVKELENINKEQQERIRENMERRAETSPEKSVEDARKEALEVAHELEQKREDAAEKAVNTAERVEQRPLSKRDKDASYKRTMSQVQKELKGPSRTFSKVIHNKAVEATSEAMGNTIARPNAILSGAVFAFLFTTVTLLVARHYGYPLSGFESIGAFILGWIIGVMIDFIKAMIRGR